MKQDTDMTETPSQKPVDWYARRHELEPDMVFTDFQGDLVMLDRRTPGDGSRWNVLTDYHGSWVDDGATIEPGDLRELIPQK